MVCCTNCDELRVVKTNPYFIVAFEGVPELVCETQIKSSVATDKLPVHVPVVLTPLIVTAALVLLPFWRNVSVREWVLDGAAERMQ